MTQIIAILDKNIVQQVMDMRILKTGEPRRVNKTHVKLCGFTIITFVHIGWQFDFTLMKHQGLLIDEFNGKSCKIGCSTWEISFSQWNRTKLVRQIGINQSFRAWIYVRPKPSFYPIYVEAPWSGVKSSSPTRKTNLGPTSLNEFMSMCRIFVNMNNNSFQCMIS
jgi:hypothetical protein